MADPKQRAMLNDQLYASGSGEPQQQYGTLNYRQMVMTNGRNNVNINNDGGVVCSERDMLAYASIHKRSSPSRSTVPKPFPTTTPTTAGTIGEEQQRHQATNVSRGSSYVNVSSSAPKEPVWTNEQV